MKKVCLMFMLLMLLLCGCGKQDRWQKQYDLGMQYLTEGNYEEAVVAFTAAIEIEPNQALAYVGRGDAYIGSGETDGNLAAALEDYQQALELDNTNVEAYLGAADVCIRRGDYDQAEAILEMGFHATEDERIRRKIEEIEEGYIFDSAGNLRMESIYGGDGSLMFYYIYSYGDGAESSVVSYAADGTEIDRASTVVDERGYVVEDWSYNYEDGRLGRNRYEYDEAGNAVRIDSYDSDGELEEIILRAYDEQGNVINEDRGLSLDDMDTHMEYEYDGQGNLIKQVETFGGEDRLETIYERDEKGNTIYAAQYHGEGELSWYSTYEYDNTGNLTKVTDYDENGNITCETLFEYDEEGNLINEEEIRHDR